MFFRDVKSNVSNQICTSQALFVLQIKTYFHLLGAVQMLMKCPLFLAPHLSPWLSFFWLSDPDEVSCFCRINWPWRRKKSQPQRWANGGASGRAEKGRTKDSDAFDCVCLCTCLIGIQMSGKFNRWSPGQGKARLSLLHRHKRDSVHQNNKGRCVVFSG